MTSIVPNCSSTHLTKLVFRLPSSERRKGKDLHRECYLVGVVGLPGVGTSFRHNISVEGPSAGWRSDPKRRNSERRCVFIVPGRIASMGGSVTTFEKIIWPFALPSFMNRGCVGGFSEFTYQLYPTGSLVLTLEPSQAVGSSPSGSQCMAVAPASLSWAAAEVNGHRHSSK